MGALRLRASDAEINEWLRRCGVLQDEPETYDAEPLGESSVYALALPDAAESRRHENPALWIIGTLFFGVLGFAIHPGFFIGAGCCAFPLALYR